MVTLPPQPTLARVVEARALTPLMRRITLEVEGLARFRDAPNVKLLFGRDGPPAMPRRDAAGRMVWPEPHPVVRTYSARSFDPARDRLVVDFLLHGAKGVASGWAERAMVGDAIGLAATGGRAILLAPRYLFVADHCALPAVARALEELPPTAAGAAFLQAEGADGLSCPPGVGLHWLGQGERLAATVRARWQPDGDDFAWIGAESADVRDLRRWLRADHGLPPARMIAVGYWRRGMTEDGYHKAFDHDRDAEYHAAQAEEYRAKGIVHG